jgi:GT2 family glycosyltransferase
MLSVKTKSLNTEKIYVVILNYQTWDDTIECVESILNSSISNYQIVIIDNNSPNDSEHLIKEWLVGGLCVYASNSYFKGATFPASKKPLPYVNYVAEKGKIKRNTDLEQDVLEQWKDKNDYKCNYPILFIQTNENLGFAGGNNVFLRSLLNSSEKANLFLLNPDTVLEKNALNLLQKYNEKLEYFVCGLTIYFYDNPKTLKSIGGSRLIKKFGMVKDVKDQRKIDSIDYIYGGALYSNIKTFQKVGLIPEDYFLYWEETDWCKRAQINDIKLDVCADAICYDKVGTSIGRGYLSEYYFTLNALKFFRKYYRKYLINVLLFQSVRYLVKTIKGKKKNALAIKDAVQHFFK